MTRRWPVGAVWLVAAALVGAACGGENAANERGITRATPSATERAVSSRTEPRAPATPRETRAPEDPAVAAWAESVCEITARFDDAVAAVQDGIDPRTLSVPERLARAEVRYGAYIESLRAEGEALAAVTPPPAVEPYHAALRTQISELERIFTEQLDMFDGAAIASEIEEANALLDADVVRLENSLALVRSRLPAAVQAALAAPERCGELLG